MIKLLPDNDSGGQVAILVDFLIRDEWIEFWNDLGLTTVTFEDLKLRRDVSDAELWRTCQSEHVILITSNRNADDPESLENTIRHENRGDALPVFTLARAERINIDRDYAASTAISLLDYLSRLDQLRGMGRIFIP
jgi:hypothetical protein